MVTKVVIEDGATVDVAANESKKKEKGKEQMSTATTTATATETEAVAQENAQLKNIIAAMRADAAQKQQQQAAPAQAQQTQHLTPEAIASLMASVAAAKEIAEKVESYNLRIDEIKKDLEETKTKLTNLPAPVAASSGGGSWDGTNWVAPVLVGTAVTAAAGLGLWYFVLRD